MPLARGEVGSISSFNALGSALMGIKFIRRLVARWPEQFWSSQNNPEEEHLFLFLWYCQGNMGANNLRSRQQTFRHISSVHIFRMLNRLNQAGILKQLLVRGGPSPEGRSRHFLCYWCKRGERRLESEKTIFSQFKTQWTRDFPDGPVVETHTSTTAGLGSVPVWGTKLPYAAWYRKIVD